LDTTLQSILNLKTPTGGTPASPFEKITLRNLLESDSGINQGLLYSENAAAAAFNKKVATAAELASYGSSVQMAGTPGDPKHVVYGNFDYFLLSQIVKKLHNASTFNQALSNILTPLNITRVRQSTTLSNQQLPDEALYHLFQYDQKSNVIPLGLGENARAQNQKVPYQYGGYGSLELFEGCGGLSGSVSDVARFIASFSLRTDNPVLSTASWDNLFNNAAAATKNLSGPDAHGYHGFDWVDVVGNPSNHVYMGSKGGWLWGNQDEIVFTTGGLSTLLLFNSDVSGPPSVMPAELATFVNSNDWSKVDDLFPGFGMPSFATKKPIKKIPIEKFPEAALKSVAQVQKSMVEHHRTRPL